MKYLLDVNARVALGLLEHEFHERVGHWVSREGADLATCSITELGFVRVLAQAPQYGQTVSDARALLLKIKSASVFTFTFITDDHDVSRLPAWVKSASQTTDGHLLQLAKANRATLATLDRKIPGAFLIPGR
jgi:predicted nucleic acid-binding protein